MAVDEDIEAIEEALDGEYISDIEVVQDGVEYRVRGNQDRRRPMWQDQDDLRRLAEAGFIVAAVRWDDDGTGTFKVRPFDVDTTTKVIEKEVTEHHVQF